MLELLLCALCTVGSFADASNAFAVTAAWDSVSVSAARQEREFRWSGRIPSGRALTVEGLNGSVRAIAASGQVAEVVAVKIAKRGDVESVRIEVVEHAGGVTVCAVYPRGGECSGDDCERPRRRGECPQGDVSRKRGEDDVWVEFTVRVPPGVRFVGQTVNGDVEATSLEGSAEAQTVNGSIRLVTDGPVKATTVNGSIDAAIGRVDSPGSMTFTTVNGPIVLRLPAGIDADVEAETVHGDISADFATASSRRFGPQRLSATLGAGGREVRLETVNGDIEVRSRS